jgi:hypothetical protein
MHNRVARGAVTVAAELAARPKAGAAEVAAESVVEVAEAEH